MNTKVLDQNLFDFEPSIEKRLQNLERETEKSFKLSTLLASSLNISMREDSDYKYVDIESNDKDNKSLKIDINESLINIQKKAEESKW